DTATLRMVTPGKKFGGLWLIDKGLKPGERVVTEGEQKIKDGMKVNPVLARASSPLTPQEASPSSALLAAPKPVKRE
ncbi:MAG: multidrug transporter subunit MdtA, partial [Candidatus Binataceae bacterium]